MEDNVFLQLEGNTNDLLAINNDNSMRCTRLIQLEPDIKPEEDEILEFVSHRRMYMVITRGLINC